VRAPRDILKHVSIEVAKGNRKCHRNRGHRIARGETCVVVQEASFGGSKNYCVLCGPDILDAAKKKLHFLNIKIQPGENLEN